MTRRGGQPGLARALERGQREGDALDADVDGSSTSRPASRQGAQRGEASWVSERSGGRTREGARAAASWRGEPWWCERDPGEEGEQAHMIRVGGRCWEEEREEGRGEEQGADLSMAARPRSPRRRLRGARSRSLDHKPGLFRDEPVLCCLAVALLPSSCNKRPSTAHQSRPNAPWRTASNGRERGSSGESMAPSVSPFPSSSSSQAPFCSLSSREEREAERGAQGDKELEPLERGRAAGARYRSAHCIFTSRRRRTRSERPRRWKERGRGKGGEAGEGEGQGKPDRLLTSSPCASRPPRSTAARRRVRAWSPG